MKRPRAKFSPRDWTNPAKTGGHEGAWEEADRQRRYDEMMKRLCEMHKEKPVQLTLWPEAA